MSVFCTGSKKKSRPINIFFSGTGSQTNCYATINNTEYYAAGDGIALVNEGDIIKFYIRSIKSSGGYIKIDNETVASITDSSTIVSKTYNWTIPKNIENILISFSTTGPKIIATTT